MAAPSTGPERAWQATATASLGALGLFLPFSTAGTSIALAVLLVLCVLAPLRLWSLAPWREPFFAVGLVLLGYIALRSLASGDPASAHAVNQYHELLMIPLLWAVMRLSPRRDVFLYGLLVGAVGLALAHWLPLPDGPANKVALRRISAGFGLSVCAFVFFDLARQRRFPRALGFGAAAFLAVTVIALVAARTGYVTLTLLGVCAAWRASPARWRWVTPVAVIAGAVVVTSLLSTVREQRGDIANSNRIRTELLQHTLDVAREHWVFGTGWTGYGQAYQAAAARRGTPPDAFWARSENPHNEYLMQLVAGGLPALALFVAWVAVPVLRPWRRAGGPAPQDAPLAGTLACVALAFAAGAVFNSMLLDFVEAHLYGAVVAWLLASRDP
jgi:O-antigen ligase